ncbi:MAG: hypothetical protein ACYCO9_00290 [Streptosporangiaceae bacterium]
MWARSRYLVHITGRAPRPTILERSVNGLPGLAAQQDGVTVTVLAFHIADHQITRIWAIRNPGKLRSWLRRTWRATPSATGTCRTGNAAGTGASPGPVRRMPGDTSRIQPLAAGRYP